MKIIAIGDIHGRDSWKKAKIDEADKVIFLGDYADSYDLTGKQIVENLERIIDLKRRFPSKIELLLGNHDVQYLFFPEHPCPGFNPEIYRELIALFQQYEQEFKIAYQTGQHLFTHAGVTNKWFEQYLPVISSHAGNLADRINAIHKSENRGILHTRGIERGGSKHVTSGPLWAGMDVTSKDALVGYHQVVGHTPVSEIMKIGNKDTSITYADILGYVTRFYEMSVDS